MFVQNGAPLIENCDFLNNNATRGGGLFINGPHANGESSTIVGCLFESNNANGTTLQTGCGGGIACSDTNLIIETSIITANTSSFGGGGIYSRNSNVTMSATRIDENSAQTIPVESPTHQLSESTQSSALTHPLSEPT